MLERSGSAMPFLETQGSQVKTGEPPGVVSESHPLSTTDSRVHLIKTKVDNG